MKKPAKSRRAKATRPKKTAPRAASKKRAKCTFDPARIVEDYVEHVLAAKTGVGRFVKLAAQRYQHDRRYAHRRGWKFDLAKAREACLFFPGCLRFTKGGQADKPFLPLARIIAGDYEPGQISNFVPAPFQVFQLWNVYGWVQAKSGHRRYTLWYSTMARKGGKSELAAGIALKQGLCDNPPEPGARVVLAAAKKEQAFDTTYLQCTQMVEASPVLSRRAKVFQYAISTETRPPQPNSYIKAIGSNSRSSDGFDLSAAILDELHAWDKRHEKFYGKLTTASGARRQPLTFIITTAGDDQSYIWLAKDGLFSGILESAVYDDIHVADHVFVFIARLDEERSCSCSKDPHCRQCQGKGIIPGDDIFDEAAWPKANPNYPVTPSLKSLREMAALAKLDATQLNDFKRYHCNIKSSSFDKALAPGVWSRCGTGLSDWTAADVVAGGIDVGERDDLASLALVARFTLPPLAGQEPQRDQKGKELPSSRFRFECRSLSWSPEQNTNRDMAREPWKSWADRELLVLSPGDTVDLEGMQERVIALGKQHKVRAFRSDPFNARQLLQNVEKAGFEAVEHKQSPYMFNEPVREFLRAVKDGRVSFDAASEPILTWAMANLIIRRNQRGEYMPDKGRSPDKIDPAVAVLMAFAEALYFQGKPKSASRPYSGQKGTGMWG